MSKPKVWSSTALGPDNPPAGNLARQYAIASFPVVAALTVALGWWVTRSIEHQVIHSAAANVALYVQSFLAPELRNLRVDRALSPREIARMEGVLANTPLGNRIRSVKIWQAPGRLAYHSDHALIGQEFPVSDSLALAWAGEVTASLDDLHDEEDEAEAGLGVSLLEIYSPVRAAGSEDIVAVVEFYQDAEALQDHIRRTRVVTWLVVVIATTTTFALLFGIVLRGSGVIREQREALASQVRRLTELLEQNSSLTARLRGVAARRAEANEQVRRRVSAELHDGPAQSLSVVLLRLDALAQPPPERGAGDVVEELRTTLAASLSEIRSISQGLALPELDGLGICDTVKRALAAHEQLTGMRVALTVDDAQPGQIGASSRQTIYRVVQESLMNVHRHATGATAEVSIAFGPRAATVAVCDDGPGFNVHAMHGAPEHLGLHGLRERLEALDGTLEICSTPHAGTRLVATVPLEEPL